MASYHFNFQRLSKNKGNLAKSKFNYISRQGKYEMRDGFQFAESHNMPIFAKNDPSKFWDGADIHERQNATVAAELKIALPRELNLEQQKQIIRSFIMRELSHVPVSYAIHNDKDNHNPHAHLMFSFRILDARSEKLTPEKFFKRASKNKDGHEVGGAKKSEALDQKKKLHEMRKAIADITNDNLRKAGFSQTVSHLSHKARGLASPQPRLTRIEFQSLQKDIKELESVKDEIQKIEQEILNRRIQVSTPSQTIRRMRP